MATRLPYPIICLCKGVAAGLTAVKLLGIEGAQVIHIQPIVNILAVGIGEKQISLW